MHYTNESRKDKINPYSKLFSSSDSSAATSSTCASSTSTFYHRVVEREIGKDHHYEDKPCDDSILSDVTVGHNKDKNTKNSDKIAMFLYGITAVLLYADQNLLAPNLTAIANEFNFSDLERDKKLGGDLSMAFFLFAAPASLIIGVITDKYPSKRSMLFALCVFVGEGSCFMTYFTKNYTGLFVTRLFTGLSIGGAIPILLTLMGDYFPSKDRSKASAVLGIGTGIGISLGQGLSGYIGSRYCWRLPFLIVSVPALFLACLVVLFVQDPERGSMENCHYNEDDTVIDYNCNSIVLEESSPSTNNKVQISNNMELGINLDDNKCANVKALLQTPSFILLLCQGVVGCIPWGIVNTYLNDYFSEEKNLSVESATTLILFFGIGAFFGISSSGYWSSVIYIKYGSCYPTLYAGVMTFLAPFPLYILMNTSLVSYSFLASGCISTIAGIFGGTASPVIKSTMINVTYPSRRGIASSLHIIFDDVGKGLGPFLISIFIGLFDGDRTRAFNYGFIGWIVCGFLIGCISFFVEKDEKRVLLLVQEQQCLESSCIEDDDNPNTKLASNGYEK